HCWTLHLGQWIERQRQPREPTGPNLRRPREASLERLEQALSDVACGTATRDTVPQEPLDILLSQAAGQTQVHPPGIVRRRPGTESVEMFDAPRVRLRAERLLGFFEVELRELPEGQPVRSNNTGCLPVQLLIQPRPGCCLVRLRD